VPNHESLEENMADARQVARWIVDDIAHDISDRKGLDNEWDAIDDDVKQERG
jgi:hypothetical protein